MAIPAVTLSPSLAARYYCILKNTDNAPLAVFDDWETLSYRKRLNEPGSYTFKLRSGAPEKSLFGTDYIFEVKRKVDGLSIPWTRDFVGLHLKEEGEYSDHKNNYTSYGPDLKDMLVRTNIAYDAGTTRAYKNCPSETAMKEYVEENCGPTALAVGSNREADGVLPGFYVESSYGTGNIWEKDCAFENLQDILKGISDYSGIDYDVDYDDLTGYLWFRTYNTGFGKDRTYTGVNPVTGLNASGNYPLIYSIPMGNVVSLKYILDRTSEANVVYVLGDGDGATRTVIVRSTPDKLDSKWNRREIARPKSGYISEMEIEGDTILHQMRKKEKISLDPLLGAGAMYKLNVDLGDWITCLYEDKNVPLRIMQIDISVDGKDHREKIQLSFE